MAMKTPKREFVSLIVDDVSMVDEAANEREFLTLKNKGEQQMTTGAETNVKTTVQVDSNAARADLLTEIEEAAAKVEKGVSSKDKAEVMDATAVVTALGEIKTLVAKARDQIADVEKAKKTAGDAAAAAKVAESGQDQVVSAVLDSISKARVFTPKRLEAMKAARDTLNGLLKELEDMPDGGNKALKTEAAMPPTPPAGTSPSESGLTEITKALKDLIDVTKDLKGRLETVEKARGAPTSSPPVVTDTQVNKAADLWGPVLQLRKG